MLSKLMKYEIEATQRIFLPLYGLILIFALINKVFLKFNMNNMSGISAVPFGITIVVYCLLIAALMVMTLVVTIQRFYKNLLGDEGYLSFTLPVPAHSHIDSKMIIALMWNIVSLLVSLLSVFLLAINENNISNFSQFCMEIGTFFSQYGAAAYLLLLELIVLLVVSVLQVILQIYAATTVGNLSGKHKLLTGIGAYIGFGVIQQIITSILMNFGHGLTNNWVDLNRFFTGLTDLQALRYVMWGIFGLIVNAAVFGAAFYFFTNWMLTKKLNLE